MRRRGEDGGNAGKKSQREGEQLHASTAAPRPRGPRAPDRQDELDRLTRELAEARQQQTATAEVLKAISRSAFDLEAVLRALLDSAIRLCGATRGHVLTYDGELLRFAVASGAWPGFVEHLRDNPIRPGKGSVAGRAAAERRTVHVRDVLADPDYTYRGLLRQQGFRTVLAVPMLRDGALLGVIALLKSRVEPFSERQIELVATFADQAVIALENARLLDELQQSTREVSEALEYQTAISDVLGVISRSPSDVQPVFEAIVQCASRLCAAEFSAVARFDGALLHLAAVNNMSADETAAYHSVFPRPPDRGFVIGRAFLDGAPVQVEDVTVDPDYDPRTLEVLQRAAAYRSYLAIPISRHGAPIGAIGLGRRQVMPFTARQIELVQTFANQAVIAIENARLFEEAQARTRDLTEALEQQTATSAILRVISTSPTEVQPVFETIVRNAVALCGSLFANVFRFDGELLHFVASHNVGPDYVELLRAKYPMRPDSSQVSGRAVLTGSLVRLEDALADPDYDLRLPASATGWRRMLGVPMLRRGEPLGVIVVGWAEAGPVPKAQEELLMQFADQAVIAIENARLFDEVQARTEELGKALEQQVATGEILRVIASSPTDIVPVLNAVAEAAARLCGADDAQIFRAEADVLRLAASFGPIPIHFREQAIGRDWVTGRAVVDRRTIHVPDLATEAPSEYPAGLEMQRRHGHRTTLATPLLRQGQALGAILIRRMEVDPFTQDQIRLLEAFADQAVIAIENVRLFTQLGTRNAELNEALEQQTATAEVLRVISNSPGTLEPVFEAVLRNAVHICGAEFGVLFRHLDGAFEVAAMLNVPAPFREHLAAGPLKLGWGTATGRAVMSRQVAQIVDLEGETSEGDEAFRKTAVEVGGTRTVFSVPMLQGDEVVGAITIYREQVEPFTERQIDLVSNFASQAVIAIENANLLAELQTRNRELNEALQQQTATAEVLKVISRSTFDLETVLNTLLESATRLCDGHISWIFQRDREILRWAASYGHTPEVDERIRNYFKPLAVPVDSGSIVGRAASRAAVVHVSDVLADAEYRWGEAQKIGGYRACIGAPLLREGKVVGVLFVAKTVPKPFTEKQIELVKTFADQAVIAIENVRLLKELRESLQQQTATADVLKAISRATFDLPTVLTTLVEAAARLCEADQGTIAREQNGVFRRVAFYGFSEQFSQVITTMPVVPDRGTASGRALAEGRLVHIPDVYADPEYTFAEAKQAAEFHTILAVPMLRADVAIGVLVLTRREVRPFDDKQIELVVTFADQAAIAIENVRLFESAEARTRELARSLEDLRAAQDRLVQTEKLASLGQLTAGIAHEIKNPLNFVNNFAAISDELVGELQEALGKAQLAGGAAEEVAELSQMLRGNLDKIVQHGRRADSIVKNMLLHARHGSGEHRLVDINAIVEESLNLAYHGARAERQGFNITLERALDPTAGEVDVFPQEITRVLLNLISNGFYAAMKRKAASDGRGYEPMLRAATRNLGDRVEITIRDNGTGIPPEVRDQLFRPFFTTKPVGEGTGLGLSISHDIVVKQHAGLVEVETRPGEFTEFRIVLPRAAASLAAGAPA